jgi:hypothetical protein
MNNNEINDKPIADFFMFRSFRDGRLDTHTFYFKRQNPVNTNHAPRGAVWNALFRNGAALPSFSNRIASPYRSML